MIFFEFSPFVVMSGRVPATLCCLNGAPSTARTDYMQLAEKAYYLEGTKAVILKNRNGKTDNFDLSREDAVALVLKAVVL